MMRGNIFRRNKMGNVYTPCGSGHRHRSKLEAAVCLLLHMRMAAKEIIEIKAEDHIYLSEAKISYVVDFKCTRPDGSNFWVEAKGHPDAMWSTKLKLWKVYGPGELEIWGGTHKKPLYKKTIMVKAHNQKAAL